MNGSSFGPPSSHAGMPRAYPASPFPTASESGLPKQNGSWNTMSLDSSSSTLDLSIGSNRNGIVSSGLLSPPLDPKKKREHVSAPNSPQSPQALPDPTRSVPANGMAQRKDSASKRRKLDFGEEESSPGIWRQAAAGTYSATPGGRAPSPTSPGKLLPLPQPQFEERSRDQMDYVRSEYVDLGDVQVNGSSSPNNGSVSSGQHDSDQAKASKARAKNPSRNFMREFGSRSKNGYQSAKSFALGLNNGNASSPERRSQPPSPTSHAQSALREMPQSMRSQVCLELADLAKRESEFAQARVFFRAACQLDPLNAKAWLEYAKCEEENGHLSRAQRILADGFKFCCASAESTVVDRVSKESIILRMLRLYSRTGEILGVRQLIGTVLTQYLQSEAERGNPSKAAWSEELGEYVNGGSTPPSPTRRTPSGSPVKLSFLSAFMTSNAGANSSANVNVDDESASGAFPWRIIMEGANLEWKFGRRKLAHAVMDFLHRIIPTRAQPFMFAADLYKKEGRFEDAYRCIMTGVQNLPGAGMLYFEALQLMELIAISHPQYSQPRSRPSHSRNSSFGSREAFDMDIDDGDEMLGIQDKFMGFTELEGGVIGLGAGSDYMDGIAGSTAAGSSTFHGTDPFSPTASSFSWSMRDLIENILPSFCEKALANLSPELVWKFHAEMASLYERASEVGLARKSLSLCERSIPDPLLWKVWSHGARIELAFNNEKVARRLLMQAFQGVPKKMQSQVLLDWAHFEEILGNRDRARYILDKAIFETQNDWKVMLELVLLELRSGRIDSAIEAAKSALAIHPSTGRLWSVLIQLEHLRNYNDPILAAPFAVFKEALQEVPKSGEVWCEGARLAIHAGRLEEARKFLDFSLHFTPQYGDSVRSSAASFVKFCRIFLTRDLFWVAY
jgi:tetratricopeptide (TPR) repeat protein